MSMIGASNVRCDLDDALLNTKSSLILSNVLNLVEQNKLNMLGILYDSELAKKTWKDNSSFISRMNNLRMSYLKDFTYLEFYNEVNVKTQQGLTGHYVDDLKKVYQLKTSNPKLKVLFWTGDYS